MTVPLFATRLKNELLASTAAISDEAKGFADAAAESAAFAEEFSGPAYETVGAGEAATAVGQFFRVSNGDTPRTYTRYERTSGGSVVAAPLATTTALAASTGSDLIGTIASGTGAVARDVLDKLRERVTPEDFGAIGDGLLHPLSERYATLAAAQVDYPLATALTQQIDYCAIIAASNSQTFTSHGLFYHSGPEINLRNGAWYRMGADPLQFKRSVHIRGADSGMAWTSMARMQWAAGATAFVVHRFNTIDNTTQGVPTTGGDGSVFEGFRILGARGTPDALGGHAIRMRARAVCRDLYIEGFEGDGYHIRATAGVGGDDEGNANLFQIWGGRVQGCNEGIFCDGADANAGYSFGTDVSNNRRWGIHDTSFLGNTWVAPHSSDNGVELSGITPIRSNQATRGGVNYQAVPTATLTQLVTVEPGTDRTVWRALANISSYAIPWVGGQAVGVYRPGGNYYIEGPNNRSVIVSRYEEGGQGLSWFGFNALVVGGSAPEPAEGVSINGAQGRVYSSSAFASEGTNTAGKTITATIGGELDNGTILKWSHSDDTPAFDYRLHRSGADWVVDNANAGNRIAFTLTGELTARQFGTGVGVPFVLATDRLALGPGSFGRFITYSNAAPTTGAHAAGEVVFNTAPTAGGKVGWVCTTAGTPGTWKQFGVIDA